MAIGIYIGTSGIASSYGAAGSVLAALLWIYYSAQIFLFGAEFTRAYADYHRPNQFRAKPVDNGAGNNSRGSGRSIEAA